MKIINTINYYGLWIVPISLTAALKAEEILNFEKSEILESENILCVFLISLLPMLYIYSMNCIAYKNGKREFKTDSVYVASEKAKAKYPKVSKDMCYKEPTGVVFGKSNGKYVCKDIRKDGHVMLIGGSGSGKSSCCVIDTLLANDTAGIFALDIKGELSYKTARYDSEKVKIFNPQEREAYGYDALFALNSEKNITEQRILEVMQNIAFSLIPMPADIKDPFWKLSARNLLIGLLIFYFKKGKTNLVDITDAILGQPVEVSVEDVMQNVSGDSIEYRYIVQFSEMDEETLAGIVLEMNNHLLIFSNDRDVRYAFKDNPRKINPQMLEQGKSIYLSMREEKLSAYYDVMQMILNQTLGELEKRPEDANPIIVVIDELPRILSAGKLDRLLDGARTLRSRKVTLFMVTQSTEALMAAYTENEVADMLSNCSYIIVLSTSSEKTQKAVISWCGKYKEKKQTWSEGERGRKKSITYEEKDIVEASELITLPQTGEAILISPYGYNRIKKVPYYQDSYLKPLADEIIQHNKKERKKNNEKSKENQKTDTR